VVAQAPRPDRVTDGAELAAAQEAYEHRRWADACVHLAAADRQGLLDAERLDRLGTAAYLTGATEDAAGAWERAYGGYLRDGAAARGVRCAFWLAIALVLRGEHARAGGWLQRAQRVLAEAGLDCVELGYLQLPAGLRTLHRDPDAAYATFQEVTAVADRFGDPDLQALGRLGQGQALAAAGDAGRGVAMLDEAMVAVTGGEVSPIAAGIIYCTVILVCRDVFDVRRAQEWTAALSRWCASQPDLKPYRGQCLVHRSEIMQLRGDWSDALDEARQACAHLSEPPGDPVFGMALYQQAQLLRLRGELDRAEEAYRRASECGHPAQPGLALLRLAQGRVDDALAAIRRLVGEAEEAAERSRVLAAQVEIALAAGELDAARHATDELDRIATDFDSAYLRATAGYARGMVLLAGGEPAAAGPVLRRAWLAWLELDAPYEAAQARVAIARACRQLGDRDTAELELAAAGRVFAQLGAQPALAQVRELSRPQQPRTAGGLTPRELEVLRLVATGAGNREVADTLVISEKTVARHLANIFAKLDLPSRSAATAYAYRHHLV
jgi:ATP/maltotriose-dependent transcriptional regulator MalT